MHNESHGLLIRRILSPITVLGPGRRTGIWLQGCSIHCPGCSSPETWEFDIKYFKSFEKITNDLRFCIEKGPDGITILGGEPFDQPEGLFNLLTILWNIKIPNILVYSGYSYEVLKEKYSEHLQLIDILISGPFIEIQANSRIWCGSDNQLISVISQRAKSEFSEYDLNQMKHPENRKLEIFTDKDQIIIIGIPKRGDMTKLNIL